MNSNKLLAYNLESAATRVSNGYAYLNQSRRDVASDASPEKDNFQSNSLDGIGAIVSMISDSLSIYDSASALAATDPNKIKFSIELKNDSPNFLTLNNITKPSGFSLTKSCVYLQPGTVDTINFEADNYNGDQFFTISFCCISADLEIIKSESQFNQIKVQDTPLVYLKFQLNNNMSRLSEVGVGAYTRASSTTNSAQNRRLTSFEYTGSSDSLEPSFIISCLDSSAKNVKGESISNSVLISPSGIRSSLAPGNIIPGENLQFSGWNVQHQILKDIFTNNIDFQERRAGRIAISTILTIVSLAVGLASTGLNIANSIKSRTKKSDNITLSCNILNATDFDIFIYESENNLTQNATLIDIQSGKSGVLPLIFSSSNTSNINTRILMTLRSKSSNTTVRCILWLEIDTTGIIFISGVRFGSSTLSNDEKLSNNLIKNYYYRSSRQSNLNRKFITVGTSSVRNTDGGDLSIVFLSD
ncbi:hypothetical protein [Pantoea sp. AS142]|uniref:hypothetical protein n=1 Tax=Pantoea sp. AS142 TaxID=3081292 RepID=UPI0030186CD1